MAFLEGKTPQQKELEKKIKALRDAGMNASADNLQKQLDRYSHTVTEKVLPMKPHELARHAKAQKAIGNK
jgi:hypothetical protein